MSGDIVYVKAGNYGNEQVGFEKSGTANNPVIFEGYRVTPGDNPDLHYAYGDALDASVMPLLDGGDRTTGTGMDASGTNYLIIKNFQITNYESAFITWSSSGSHLTIENIIAQWVM